MVFRLSQMILLFFLYGFAGWVLMSLVRTAVARRPVSAGFVSGPLYPSFGVAAVILLRLASVLSVWPPLVFFAAALLVVLGDALAALAMRVLFRARLRPAGQSRLHATLVLTLKAIAGGLLGALLVFVVQPWADGFLARFSQQAQSVLAAILSGVFLLDFVYSLDVMDKVLLRARRITEAQAAGDAAAVAGQTAFWRPGHQLLLAMPGLRLVGHEDAVATLRSEWSEGARGGNSRAVQAAGRVGRQLAETACEMNPFAEGIGFYKLVWVFAIACVLGYLIETAFCLVLRGQLENRQGMVYGPFNQVYGFGAVLMLVLLHPMAKRSDRWLFVGGALLGGAYEFACSWLQEKVYGTVSWDYSTDALSVGGRTSIQLMLCWGVLGVVFIKGIYPHISALIERIPRRPGIVLTWVIAIGLVLDMGMSAMAVGRWTTRQGGEPPRTDVGVYLDRHFPDDVMEAIYPSMQVVAERDIQTE